MEFKNVKIFPLTWHTKSSSLKREMPPYVAFFSSPYFPHLPDSGDHFTQPHQSAATPGYKFSGN